MSTLFIHPRKGLFQLTRCKDCGHNFQCTNCDANLVTYRTSQFKLELICHQCQSFYNYPNKCPNCHGQNISSLFAGIDELANFLKAFSQVEPYKYGSKSPAPEWLQNKKSVSINTRIAPKGLIDEENIDYLVQENNSLIQITQNSSKVNILSDTILSLIEHENAVTTRVFDPQIPYEKFHKIVFVQADNLLASPDYLVQEDIHKQIAELLVRVSKESQVYFDTFNPDLDFFQEIKRLNEGNKEYQSVQIWYNNFLLIERRLREKFKFPPFYNLLLITSQEKNKENALTVLQDMKNYISKIIKEIPEIEVGSPYPARFFKRKNLFSYHILIRYPKGYSKFSVLRQTIGTLALQKRLQVRLNPKHLF